jgi:hypothetical protein
VRVDHIALELADADEHDQAERCDVERLLKPDRDDEDCAEERPDHRDDLDEADESAEQEPVVETRPRRSRPTERSR